MIYKFGDKEYCLYGRVLQYTSAANVQHLANDIFENMVFDGEDYSQETVNNMLVHMIMSNE